MILVDESHNFRNRDSGRYENLSRLIGLNGGRGEHGYRKKLILMTATPINNSVMDLHNQIRFFTRSDNAFFAAAGIGRLDKYFLAARRKLLAGDGTVARAVSNLLDEVVIRRTRQFIEKAYPAATVNGKKVRFPSRRLRTVRYDLEGTYAGIYQRIVRSIEDLKLVPYDLETYKANPDDQDAMLAGRGQALVGIFKSRYLKRLESSVAAFRISVFRLMEYLLTFRHYVHGNVLLEPMDFWKLLGTIERDLEDDAQAQEHAEEDDNDEERSIPQPRSRHAEIEANPKAAALLKQANRLPAGTYDVQRLNDALDADLQALRGVFDLVHPIKAADDKKLQRLREMLAGQPAGTKVLVFTAFRDTVRYLYRWIAKDAEIRGQAGGPAGSGHSRRNGRVYAAEHRTGICSEKQRPPRVGRHRTGYRHPLEHRRLERGPEPARLCPLDQLRPALEPDADDPTGRPHRPYRDGVRYALDPQLFPG